MLYYIFRYVNKNDLVALLTHAVNKFKSKTYFIYRNKAM